MIMNKMTRKTLGKLLRPSAMVCAVAVVAAGGLSGCSDGWRLDDHTAVTLNQPEKRHAISFADRREVLYIEMPHMGASLSPRQLGDVQRFLGRYRREGEQGLRLSTPRSARGHMAAQRSVAAIRRLMARSNIPESDLRRGRHRTIPSDGETIQLAFRRPVAVAPQCGDWSENVGEDHERLPYNNFGCATQRNLAKMVANSRDLIVPQPETPRSSERRSIQWSEYVKGGAGSGSSSSGSSSSSSSGTGAAGK